ncbi:MAG: ATP-binding protein [candidate division WOR-3 bacterium]|nr:ATP-binding protein [candidate division WOR-3 bacterium]
MALTIQRLLFKNKIMDKKVAQLIINKLGSSGTPPEIGVELFSIGLDKYLKVIEDEYLNGILKNYHLSSFKLVVGNYGGGKTHFLYSVRNLAFKNGYVVVYVPLNPTECPFDKLELVYKQIINNIQIIPKFQGDLAFPITGIEAFIEHWFSSVKEKLEHANAINDYLNTLRGIESISFLNAVKGAFFNLSIDNSEEFIAVIQYLKGEEVGKEIRARYRISERIDKSTAFRMIRSFIQWIHLIGYSGVIFLFDEAERGISMSSSKDKRKALDNLRQIVDECGNSRLPGAMFFYAIPDENLLLEGAGGVYEALKQRLTTVFSNINPLGVKIDLEKLGISPVEFLNELGEKLVEIFCVAYDFTISPEDRKKLIKIFSEKSALAYGYDISYRRLFIVALISALQSARNEKNVLKQILTNSSEVDKFLRITSRKLITEEQKNVTETEF